MILFPRYEIRDHLESVRNIVNASGSVVERNDYYPFGSRTTFGASYATLASNRQKFSGKEDQTTVAGSTLPYLDFGARMYDAKLVRWNTYDPMAEKDYGINPYVYCAGNPIIVVDPDGRLLKILDGESLLAIYNGLGEGQSITISFNENGMVDASSFKDHLSDFFIKDLYEIASNEEYVIELSTADSYDHLTNKGISTVPFEEPYDVDDRDDENLMAVLATMGDIPFGKHINGNLGRTLVPTQSASMSTNGNIQIIINSKGTLNHRTVGIAHELGLYPYWPPHSHSHGPVPRITPNTVMNWTGYSVHKALKPHINIVDSIKANSTTKLGYC